MTWYGNLGVREKEKLNCIVNLSSKIIGFQQQPLSQIYHDFVSRKVKKILSDDSHLYITHLNLCDLGVDLRNQSGKRKMFSFTSLHQLAIDSRPRFNVTSER